MCLDVKNVNETCDGKVIPVVCYGVRAVLSKVGPPERLDTSPICEASGK